MGLWRCYQGSPCATDEHGRWRDFESDVPVCPGCGCDGRQPEGRGVINARAVLHLLVKDKAGPIIGRGSRLRILCNPALKLSRVVMGTGEPSIANCPACLAHADFPKDFPEMDPENVPDWKVGRDLEVRT